MAEAALSHDQIWDDSALLDTWDAAVVEYKVNLPARSGGLRILTLERQNYHSLAAKGEKIDISAAIAEQEALVAGGNAKSEEALPNGDAMSGVEQKAATEATTSTVPVAAGPVPAALPQALLNSGKPLFLPLRDLIANLWTVQDQNVQNLMMSWYYAGYYTGVYEGQQKAYASMQESG